MASVALFAAGSAIGGSVGGAVATTIGGVAGGLVGSIIDQQFLFPTQSADIKGPRIDDYPLQTASEGSSLRYDLGPENKHTGVVMWIGLHNGNPFEERSASQSADSKGGSGGSSTTYSYYADFAVALCEGPIAAVRRIWADSKVIYTADAPDDRYEAITLYTGDEAAPTFSWMAANTSPSSHIESFEGSGNVPAFKNTAYIVFDSLHLADFGNRIPTISVLVEAQTNLTVGAAILKICERAGLTAGQVDVTRVPDCLWGYSFTGPVSMTRALEPILAGYDLIVQEHDGKLHFIQRGDEITKTVIATDMPASSEGSSPPYPLTISEVMDADLPSEVNVTYIDANAEYGQGSVPRQRINFETANVEVVNLPLVFTPDQAASLASRRLWRAYTERKRVTLRLPYSYIRYQEGDVLLVPFNSETYELLVESRDRGENGVLEFQCVVRDVTASTLEETGGEDSHLTTSDGVVYTAPAVTLRVFEVPALITAHALQPGVYVAATLDPTTIYRGGGLYESATDVDSGFALQQALPPLGVSGVSSTALAAASRPGVWDEVNSVTVTVVGGTLSSASALDVLNGANWAYLGGEIIAFKTATLVSTGVYTLSGLLRELKHTNGITHTTSDEFVLLAPASVLFDKVGGATIGSTRYFRAVTSGGAVGDFTSDSELIDGQTVRAYSPSHFTGSRDGSNNLTINWNRRSRDPQYDVLSATIAPNLEGQEVYELDILSGSGGTVVRTITITDATTTAYSAANQTTDGLTPGNTIYFVAYMIDATYGRGFSTEEQSL